MSTLKTNTIQHLTSGFNNVIAHTDGAGTANAVHARAWVNFDGTSTVTIRASFNVSSITDNGTGNYLINFSNALSDSSYPTVAGGWDDGVTPLIFRHTQNVSSSQTQFYAVNSSSAARDISQAYAAIFR